MKGRMVLRGYLAATFAETLLDLGVDGDEQDALAPKKRLIRECLETAVKRHRKEAMKAATILLPRKKYPKRRGDGAGTATRGYYPSPINNTSAGRTTHIGG